MPLWKMDLKENVLAAVSEGEAGESKKKLIGLTGNAPYFNSGLLVMDLAAMRCESATEVLMANTVEYASRIAWPDQDIINITFRDRIHELSPVWNSFNIIGWKMKKSVVIHHFANASQKPWCNIWKNCSWPLYLRYLRRSPYCENAFRFVWGHIKGFFYFKYTKKQVTRYLVCGIRVFRRKEM
jgi:lipopolysaccharide biosynthesis glycosyltransferase